MDKKIEEETFINLDCIPLNAESGNEKDANEIENEHMQKLGNEINYNENFFIAPEEFEFDLDKIRSKKTSLIVLENTTIRNQSKTSFKKGQIKLIAPFIRKKFRIKFKKFHKKALDKKKTTTTALSKDSL